MLDETLTVDVEVDAVPAVTVTDGSELVTATVLMVAPMVVALPAVTPVRLAV